MWLFFYQIIVNETRENASLQHIVVSFHNFNI